MWERRRRRSCRKRRSGKGRTRLRGRGEPPGRWRISIPGMCWRWPAPGQHRPGRITGRGTDQRKGRGAERRTGRRTDRREQGPSPWTGKREEERSFSCLHPQGELSRPAAAGPRPIFAPDRSSGGCGAPVCWKSSEGIILTGRVRKKLMENSFSRRTHLLYWT